MAKDNTKTTVGLGPADAARMHFDIYAVLEGTQELYFGHDVEVNVNMVETVTVRIPNGNGKFEDVEKCYLSPTKRRGVERRSLIWAPTGETHDFLGNVLGCTIPATCAKETCPICMVFGALITEAKKGTTLVGRLVHGGGVAIQTLEPHEKQRAMHPARLRNSVEIGENMDVEQEDIEHEDTETNEVKRKNTPMPFKRQYDPPGLLFPVYNHCLSITDAEFGAVAYAFLDALARLGAGNPKGLNIHEASLFGRGPEPVLVVDRYRSPMGRRPTISPAITDVARALEQFARAAADVPKDNGDRFTRYRGCDALATLRTYADRFVQDELETR